MQRQRKNWGNKIMIRCSVLKGKKEQWKDLSEQGNCELFCLGTKLMKRANAPKEIFLKCEGLFLWRGNWPLPKELRGLRKGPKKTEKEGQESWDWAHLRPKETPIRESYRKGRTDHATWQILRRCNILLMCPNKCWRGYPSHMWGTWLAEASSSRHQV